ncbi:hypothetical protein OJF2_74470 [Aquisphaera giovannonii]|uniref:Uncharacterized protein n=1 Tax=Aquisphaera giovannonii TaxID=406548 RepID=A0A5B9WE70_9BACT|nr:hypothetical protein OJF2_74470 [Aquisphaera giovannonii]
MRRNCIRLFIPSLMTFVIGSAPFLAGCESSQEGTSAQFDAKANLKQQDAMRSYMEKNKPSAGKAAKAKGKAG